MARYGSPSGVFCFDGYNLLAHKLQGIRVKVEALTEPYTGIGDAWEENIPVGTKRAELAQEGGFFHDATGSIHERLAGASGSPDSDPNGTPGVGLVGYAGNTVGSEVLGFSGVLGVSYDVVAAINALQRANVEYVVTGQVSKDGVILHALGTRTADGDSESNSVDNAASSASGGHAYLVVTDLDLDGGTALDVVVQDSPDDAAWTSLVAFDSMTAVGGSYKSVAGTVDRYLSATWDFTGSPGGSETATFIIGFARA